MRSPLKFLLPFCFAACGTAAGPDYTKTLVTLNGTITSSAAAPSAPVRVALVWELANPQPGTGSLKSAQELGVRTQFPVDFQLDVNTLPPEEAMTSIDATKASAAGIDPNLRYAYGTLLVYADTNGDGKLDLLPLDAQSSTDEVLGVAQDLVVAYLEGTPPPASDFMGIQLSAGFNLLQQPAEGSTGPTTCVGCAAPDAGSTDAPQFTLLPLSTQIPIALTAAPELARYLCEQDDLFASGGSAAAPSSGPGGAFVPPPAGAQITCSADGLSFAYQVCPQGSSLCSSTPCTTGESSVAAGSTLPAGWPCN
jgi:hypothetical protein